MRVVKVGAGEEERREGEEMEKGMVGKEGRGEKKGRRGEEETRGEDIRGEEKRRSMCVPSSQILAPESMSWAPAS